MVGPNCVHRADEHYHVRQVTVSSHDLSIYSSQLADLVAGRIDAEQFRSALRSSRTDHKSGSRDQVSQTASSGARVQVHDAAVVQVGSANTTESQLHCVIHETTLPLVDLLADSRALVESFASAMREKPPGDATSGFLRDLAAAGHALDDATLLGYSSAPKGLSDAFVGSLFGHVSIKDADTVMLGNNITFERATDIKLPGLNDNRIRSELDRHTPSLMPPSYRAHVTSSEEWGSHITLNTTKPAHPSHSGAYGKSVPPPSFPGQSM
jgi:hypothetical protein